MPDDDPVVIRSNDGAVIAVYADNQRVRGDVAAQILAALLGIPIAKKTLANWRARGIGPEVEYFGIVPIYRVGKLKHYAAKDALKQKSIRRRNREAREDAPDHLSLPPAA